VSVPPASGRPCAPASPGRRGRRRAASPSGRSRKAPHAPGRDATPSNRSAEASRAPRGHVNDVPLASRRGRVGQPPPEAGPGGSREATVTHHGPPQIGFSCPLRCASPCGARSRPSIPPCSVLSASLQFALRLPLGLPSLAPFGARLRFGGLSSPNFRKVAPRATQGQWTFAKSRCSPHLFPGHPQRRRRHPQFFPMREAREASGDCRSRPDSLAGSIDQGDLANRSSGFTPVPGATAPASGRP
jgi:hypothetical protein